MNRRALALGAALGFALGIILCWPHERPSDFAGGPAPLLSPYPGPYHPPYHNAFASGSFVHVFAVAVLAAYVAALIGAGLADAYARFRSRRSRHGSEASDEIAPSEV